VALFYLQRFAASAETLRRVLRRRVERSVRLHGTDRAEGNAMAERVVARMVAAGLVDDRAFAHARAARLHGRGASARLIAAHLQARGIAAALVDDALAGLDEAAGGGENRALQAAIGLARRRRLGPFRPPSERAAMRQKDLAALARAGFSYAIAKRIVDAETPEDAEGKEATRISLAGR
jgi:regulatory protein